MNVSQAADRIIDEAGPHEFVKLQFYGVMEHKGFSREVAIRELKRLMAEGRWTVRGC